MMFEENEPVVASSDDIVITACPTLVEENRATQEFLWGYYFCIETILPSVFSWWAKAGTLPMTKATVFVMIRPVSKVRFPSWSPAKVLSSPVWRR